MPATRTTSRAPPMHRVRKVSTKTPRAGSVANACTEMSTPERTRNVPSRLSENATIASSSVQLPEQAALLRHGQRMNECGARRAMA